MKLKTLTLTAALLCASAFAWPSPGAAVPLGTTAGSIPALAQAQQDSMVIQVQRRRGRVGRGGGGGVGAGVAAGIIGAVIGGMIVNEAARQQEATDEAVAYCMRRFRSYDPSTGTYMGRDGQPHPCP